MAVSDGIIQALREKRRQYREDLFKEFNPVLGSGAVDALSSLADVYDEKMYIWLAGLWEPRIGGFYYSPSARDNEGFLPDLESTGQALQFIQNSGLCQSYADIPQKLKTKMITFAQGLQSPEDGFFYHPQWGSDIPTSRRGRDLVWANGILNRLGADMLYPSPLDIATDSAAPRRAEHLTDLGKFKAYLLGFEASDNKYCISSHSYPFGNLIASQAMQIKAAGEEYVKTLVDFLNGHQYSDSGLWEEHSGYDPINGLMKISTVYSMLGVEMPHAEEALERAVEVALSSDNPPHICCIYNPLYAVNAALGNVKLSRGEEYSEKIRGQLILSRAEELLSATKDKASLFKKADGSFSMRQCSSAERSQGVPVAVPNTNEGDLNSTKISLCAIWGESCRAVGIKMPPLFTEDDGRLFFELMEPSLPITEGKEN